MYFRFGSALVLAVLVAFAGIAIEKQCLALKRSIIRQQYRREVLGDEYARLRLETQQLGAPIRLFQALEQGRLQPGPREVSNETAGGHPRFVAWRPSRHTE
jgi:hypothetical protein